MNFNRDIFFSEYRKRFGKLTEIQAKGLERLLTGYERYYGWWDNLDQIANSLAQIKLETAHSFHPVVEGYYLAKGVPPDDNYYNGNYPVVKNFQKQLYYFPFFGRGDIQLTHEENYREQDELIKKYFPEIVSDFESRSGQKLDLVKHPEQVLDGSISFSAMTIGMHKGTFREGQTLDRYINNRMVDDFNARNIVNGDRFHKDKQTGEKIGEKIVKNAHKFREILNFSLIKNNHPAFDDLREDEINLEIPETIPATNPAVSPPENPASNPSTEPVESNLANSAQPVPAAPLGDAPNREPQTWLNVEDWKGWVFSKLKWCWGSFTGANLTQFTGNAFAAVNSGENWWIYLAIAAVIFILTIIVAFLITVGLLAIWYFNRKEIKEYLMLAKKSQLDPTSHNLGLRFERI